nr:D-Ala-D-Ala carboxypeptidase family metallohydrolase [uncultured Dethiosulfovibrio sp.]
MNHSEHFSRQELSCRCGCGACEMKPELLLLAEKIRVILGEIPIYVTSAYRCKKHNAKVGGSPTSRHMEGQAMDFYVRHLSVSDAHDKILKAWSRGVLPELGGIGLYKQKNFIHVDVSHAPNGHLRRWNG